ncbi:MAG TPA: RHS repeat-associated core domain-containing protein [Candidatus Angelobacter sp.]
MRIPRSFSLVVLTAAVLFSALPGHAQSVCNAVSNNPLVMQMLCSEPPKAEAVPATLRTSLSKPPLDLQPITAEAINHMRLVQAPPIRRGDVLTYEANRSDFMLELFFGNGKEIVIQPLTQTDAENTEVHWKHGETKLDYPETLNQRIMRMRIRALHQIDAPLLLRGVKIVRDGQIVRQLQVTYTGPSQPSFDPPTSYPPDPMTPNPHVTNVSLSRSDLWGHQPDTGFLAPKLPSYSMNPMMFQSTTTSAGDPNHYKFDGKELDAETGLYNFGARYYSPALGRYMSPDWSARPTTVPYADLSNPQTLNLYTFGRNNPTSIPDSDGHCPGDNCSNVQVTVTADSPPHMIINGKVPGAGGGYVSGAGTTTTITFSGNKSAPLPGMSVKETPVTTDNLTGKNVPNQSRQETIATGPNGTIHDVVGGVITPVTSEPQNFSKEDLAGMKDVVTTVPYNHTTDQTLTFTTTGANGQPCNCQATYSETMNNADAKGNLNTQNNSQGINMNLTITKPVVKEVEKKPDQK